MAEVQVTLSAHHKGKAPGDKISVDQYEAKRLVRAGVAVPSSVPEAKKIDVDPETAATKRS